MRSMTGDACSGMYYWSSAVKTLVLSNSPTGKSSREKVMMYFCLSGSVSP